MIPSHPDYSSFERLVNRLAPGHTLLRAWPLTGGVSAQVTALEMQRPDGTTQKWVVRQHGAVDRQRNPSIAADEFTLLHLIHSVGIPAPKPYHLDVSGTIFATPALVLEYIEGQPDFAPADLDGYLHQLATHLARIHQIKDTTPELTFLPQHTDRVAARLGQRPSTLDDTLDEGRIRATLAAVWPLALRNPSVLLHGDFWPGNVLCREGQIVGIIDWEDAALGDPLADLATTRLEVLWAFGAEAMRRLTQQYQAISAIDDTDLPYWDLYAALRPIAHLANWGLDAAVEQTMRDQHRWFVAHAFQKLTQTV